MPHIHEKIDFTAEVFIVHRNRVLLRKHDKYKIWLSVGGHVELDEDPNETAIREVREEVGLDIKLFGNIRVHNNEPGDHRELVPPIFMKRHRISPTHEHIVMTFFATSESDQVVVSGHDASHDIIWASREDLETIDLLPDIKHYAERALDTLSV